VVGVVFAIAPDQSAVGYAIAMDEVRTLVAAAGKSPVSVGPCTV
jgi:hypothetical protein